MIKLENIHIEYDRVLLDHEKMIIPSSQITLLSGKSGSGKSALLYRIGLITVDCDIYYDDKLVKDKEEINELRKDRIGFVLQDSDIIDHLSVKDNLCHYALMINKELDDQQILILLNEVMLDVPLNQSALTLSLGQRQRLALACTLVKDPDIFILDEPTASLDEENEIIIFNILNHLAHDLHKTIVVSSHSDKALEYADRIYIFKDTHLLVSQEKEITEEHREYNRKDINKNFYKVYTHHYFKKYKNKYLFLSLIMFVILMLSCLGYTSIDYITNMNKNILYSSFDKLLYVTKDSDSYYSKDNYKLENYNLKDNEHPYIKVTLSQDSSIYIIPYYDNQDLSDRLTSYNKTNNKHGIYISNNIKTILMNYYGDLSMDLTLKLNIYANYNIVTKDVDTKVLGFIKSGVYDYYNKKNNKYIYMYYQDIEELVDSQEYVGFVAEFNDYDELKKAKEEYIKQGYSVNDSFIDTDQIDELVNYYTKIEFIFASILLIVGVSSVVLLNINLFMQRKREFALLLINGIPYSMLLKIVGYEYYKEIRYPFIVYVITNIILLIILQGNILLMLFSVLFIVISLSILILLYKILICKLNIERILRD